MAFEVVNRIMPTTMELWKTNYSVSHLYRQVDLTQESPTRMNVVDSTKVYLCFIKSWSAPPVYSLLEQKQFISITNSSMSQSIALASSNL